jgi:hypothetical protein
MSIINQNYGGYFLSGQNVQTANKTREMTQIQQSVSRKVGAEELNKNLSEMNSFYSKDASSFTYVEPGKSNPTESGGSLKIAREFFETHPEEKAKSIHEVHTKSPVIDLADKAIEGTGYKKGDLVSSIDDPRLQKIQNLDIEKLQKEGVKAIDLGNGDLWGIGANVSEWTKKGIFSGPKTMREESLFLTKLDSSGEQTKLQNTIEIVNHFKNGAREKGYLKMTVLSENNSLQVIHADTAPDGSVIAKSIKNNGHFSYKDC